MKPLRHPLLFSALAIALSILILNASIIEVSAPAPLLVIAIIGALAGGVAIGWFAFNSLFEIHEYYLQYRKATYPIPFNSLFEIQRGRSPSYRPVKRLRLSILFLRFGNRRHRGNPDIHGLLSILFLRFIRDLLEAKMAQIYKGFQFSF